MEKDEPDNSYALCEPSHGRRPSGRPRKSFPRQFQELIDPNDHYSKDEIVRTAQDQASRRRFTADFTPADRWWW